MPVSITACHYEFTVVTSNASLGKDSPVHQLTQVNQSLASGYAHAEYKVGTPPKQETTVQADLFTKIVIRTCK